MRFVFEPVTESSARAEVDRVTEPHQQLRVVARRHDDARADRMLRQLEQEPLITTSVAQ